MENNNRKKINLEIVDEFIVATPRWAKTFSKFETPFCPVCGMVPFKMLKLLDSLKKLKDFYIDNKNI